MVSVVIVNWNTKEKLQACLASLSVQTVKNLQVIVVDNGSSDGSSEMVQELFPEVKLLAEKVNHGYAKGNNLGLNLAINEYILTLNPDTELPKDNIETAINILANLSGYGALSVKFIGPSGEVQASVRGFPSTCGILGALLKLDQKFPSSCLGSYTLPLFSYLTSGPAPQPMGTYLLFRRSVLAKFTNPSSPFDEQFPIYFNEVDLLYRMHKAGFKCWYQSTLSIFHHHGASTKQARKSMIWESHLSLIRYFKKHAIGPQRIFIPFICITSIVGAAFRSKGFSFGFRPHNNNL